VKSKVARGGFQLRQKEQNRVAGLRLFTVTEPVLEPGSARSSSGAAQLGDPDSETRARRNPSPDFPLGEQLSEPGSCSSAPAFLMSEVQNPPLSPSFAQILLFLAFSKPFSRGGKAFLGYPKGHNAFNTVSEPSAYSCSPLAGSAPGSFFFPGLFLKWEISTLFEAL